MRILYHKRKPPTVRHGLLYNWCATRTASDIPSGMAYLGESPGGSYNVINRHHPGEGLPRPGSGFIIPSDEDFASLNSFLSPGPGGKMKLAGLTEWGSPNTGAINSSGFSGLGTGERSLSLNSNPLYSGWGVIGKFWTSTVVYSYGGPIYLHNIKPIYWYLYYTDSNFTRWTIELPEIGNNVRLVNKNTTLPEGGKGVYVGNNGLEYCTICINGWEWMTENLCETKYGTGADIVDGTKEPDWKWVGTGIYDPTFHREYTDQYPRLTPPDGDWGKVRLI